ncbi:dicarboxylate/amino acid:cation symporter [bacterium]|nr:dicarboxylate/amino acid:cation symporter [bacterium]
MKKIPIYIYILIAMGLGMAVGLIIGEQASPLGEIGKVFIGLVKTLAAPLLFFAILDAFLKSDLQLKQAFKMISISTVNGLMAIMLGLATAWFIKPGHHLTLPPSMDVDPQNILLKAGKIDFLKTITDYIPQSLVAPFVNNTIISIILISIFCGLALRLVKTQQVQNGDDSFKSIENGITTCLAAIQLMMKGVVYLLPFAVFGAVAKVVGEEGLSPLQGLIWYVGSITGALLIHILIIYQAWIVFVSPYSLKTFWRFAREPLSYALGTGSSLATLPITLKALDKMDVSKASSRMAACVGTNINNDGIILYEALAVLFVAQVYGIELSFAQQVLAIFSCIIAGIGISGIPDAGLISLSLVLATVGLPLEILPLLLTVDWLLGRFRAMTNVISDMTVACVLDQKKSSI